MDTLSKKRRSWNMSRIHGRDTRPEVIVRSLIHGLGFRFRIHRRDLPGSPDIVLPKYRIAVLVHGCFWHRHHCRFAYNPKSNKAFWKRKFRANKARDRTAQRALRKQGWRSVVIWECQTRDVTLLRQRISKSIKHVIRTK